MNRRSSYAGGLVGVTVLAAAARVVLSPEALAVYLLTELPALLAFAGLGAVIVARRDASVIGWLMVVAGVGTAVYDLVSTYAYRGLVEAPGTLAGARWAAWLAGWVWLPGFIAGFLLLPLLFPDGRLPSRRWRPLLRVIVAMIIIELLAQMLRPGSMAITDPTGGADIAVARNPLGLAGVAPVLRLVDAALNVGFFPLLVALAAGVVVRYRRARVIQRYQLRWFLFAVAILPFGFALSAIGQGDVLADAVAGTLLTGVPISISVAVLRHRLYEIDRIISRTVTYTLLTAVLAATYALVAILPTALFGLESDLLVAAATLLAAAAFVPVRRRVQALVDRRFNRARYDAARTIERFGSRLRDDLDLDGLAGDLRGVVASTVQPAHVSLWIRQAEGVR